jgi:CheY-like chemotaxis protein
VEEVMQLLRAGTPHNVDVRVSITPGVPPVLADTSQMHQVLMNLGTNAIYAMKDAGGVLDVSLDVISVSDVVAGPSAELYPGEHVRLSVRDTGVGMAPAVRERLFEPFFTTKGESGTGLGLSVVHGIIKEHAGAITVDSTPGVGTTFCIYLPVASENAAVRRTGLLEVIRGAGQHIMFVDDEASIVAVMSRTLRILDYRVTGFTDPVAALRAFRDNPAAFDAVITDYSMPVMSGEDLVVAMRGIRADIPAAITSGSTVRQAVNVARTGPVSWISKPASLGELSQTLNEMLIGAVVPGGDGKGAGASIAT